MAETSFSLKCHGRGKPKPMLTWSRLDGGLQSSALDTLDGSLFFSKITSSDAGRYRCTAINQFGSVVAEIELRVQGRLSITSIAIDEIFHTAFSLKNILYVACL